MCMRRSNAETKSCGKLYELWHDRRSFPVRLRIALLCAAAFCFTVIVFGPLELFIGNSGFFPFSFGVVWPAMAVTGVVACAVITAVLLLVRGKVYNTLVSLLFSGLLCGWLQRNLLNDITNHGSLDGSAVEWEHFMKTTVLNLALWAAIFTLVFLLLYFSRKIWSMAVQWGSALLLGAQAVALVMLLIRTDIPSPQNGYLSKATMFDVSPKQNVVMFLLDRYDNTFADQVLEEDPELWEDFSGFTYYRNFTGSYSRTFPSVNYILTGSKSEYVTQPAEYAEQAWGGQTLVRRIHDAGYGTKIYTDSRYTFINTDYLGDSVDNVVHEAKSADDRRLVCSMLKLSAYLYSPECLKPSFRMYTGDLDGIISTEDAWIDDEVAHFRGIVPDGVSIGDGENENGSFIFYHFRGCHDPYTMDENGNPAEFDYNDQEHSNTLYSQLRGDLKMIKSYMQQLDDLGLLDDTTIIVTADHGRTGTVPDLSDGMSRCPTLWVKPAGADRSEPMQISNKQVCQDNMRSTVLDCFGLKQDSDPRTLDEIGEDEELERYFWAQCCDESATHRDYNMLTYRITGDATDMNNWELVSTERIQCPFYDAGTDNPNEK
ncbi:MAG: hypothetical protein DBX45_08290 [Oscillospiraceae bacterium]|nr:MAG: hypothetical protein DBX45_08290 [Oscillospiraceae bacterium]